MTIQVSEFKQSSLLIGALSWIWNNCAGYLGLDNCKEERCIVRPNWPNHINDVHCLHNAIMCDRQIDMVRLKGHSRITALIVQENLNPWEQITAFSMKITPLSSRTWSQHDRVKMYRVGSWSLSYIEPLYLGRNGLLVRCGGFAHSRVFWWFGGNLCFT